MNKKNIINLHTNTVTNASAQTKYEEEKKINNNMGLVVVLQITTNTNADTHIDHHHTCCNI